MSNARVINLETPIIIEEALNASKSKVWDAITNIDIMKKWFFTNIPSFKPEVGFQTISELKRENCEAVWKFLINQLKSYLEK